MTKHNFTQHYSYGPDNPEVTEANENIVNAGAIFLKDEGGRDWYNLAKEFVNKYKGATFLQVDKNGVVVATHTDPTMFHPVGCDMVVTYDPPFNIFETVGEWLFDGKELLVMSDAPHFTLNAPMMKEIARERKEQALSIASAKVSVLRDTVDSGDATDEEKELFAKWRDYRIAVNRLDVNLGSAMVVPPMPE
ncbi:putative tail fibers protein [Salmonella phage SPHG1]|nr:putative tail fibers protein [Salmonella phage SPHG1]